LCRLGLGHRPIQIQERDVALSAHGSQEVDTALGQGQPFWYGECPWQLATGTALVPFSRTDALSGGMVPALAIHLEERRRVLLDANKVQQFELVPDVLVVVLVEAFDEAIALRMPAR